VKNKAVIMNLTNIYYQSQSMMYMSEYNAWSYENSINMHVTIICVYDHLMQFICV